MESAPPRLAPDDTDSLERAPVRLEPTLPDPISYASLCERP